MYDVRMMKLESENTEPCISMLPGEIPGAEAVLHSIPAGNALVSAPEEGTARIFLSVDGAFRFRCGGVEREVAERTVFIPGAAQPAEFAALLPARILEIRWRVPGEGRDEWRSPAREFPYVQPYASAVQYRDPNKSEKTISRELVRQRVVPGFCMGSVESYGFDRVAQHPHPMLDQFFFSFPENDVEVLIDDFKVPMKGDTLLHIPLGSNHGVEVAEGRHMHYIWIDFFLGRAGLDRLDRSHRPTGTFRSF